MSALQNVNVMDRSCRDADGPPCLRTEEGDRIDDHRSSASCLEGERA